MYFKSCKIYVLIVIFSWNKELLFLCVRVVLHSCRSISHLNMYAFYSITETMSLTYQFSLLPSLKYCKQSLGWLKWR